jgi:hypothetical protein
MHGGARGSGGPKGAHNGNYKHGLYTAGAIASRRWLRHQAREVRALTSVGRVLIKRALAECPLLGVGSIGQCNTARSLSAGVSKPKVFRGR